MIPRPREALLAGLLALMPPGRAMAGAREPDSVLSRIMLPGAAAVAYAEAEAAALQAEVDPRVADRLLDAYERVLGPDACVGDVAAMPRAERQRLAHQRWVARGGQSRAYFIGLAAALGTEISITESHATVCGRAECGDVLLAAGEEFVWVVNLPAERLIDTECGATECGDRLGDILGSQCECAIRTASPAHTQVVFNYD